ncbi:transposase [Aquincola sp. S2]|uniref:Transposase n=1 Tax=Pseudaquabacterium terrae TaxID=2732868 RepID=A0ABX2EGX0_9BURK|nr:transposase [Aquabacterium terrae]
MASAPFGSLKALPRDGKPVVKWPTLGDAFLDTVQALRQLLGKRTGSAASPSVAAAGQSSPGQAVTAATPRPRSGTLTLARKFKDNDRDNFLVALANTAMDEVRKAEWKAEAELVQQALGELGPSERRSILWAMRRNPSGWSPAQASVMHWLQRANLKSARAWRLKMGLREVFALARSHNHADMAAADLKRWISWARRSRLESFKRLGATLKEHFDAVVRGMLDHRSNAFVEAMNGQMQQAKRAARGFRTAANFIAVAYLRLGKLTHIPVSPFVRAMPRSSGAMSH